MWEKQVKKCVFTLCVDNYAPELCALTYPLIKRWADKIGAEFFTITERKFPSFPPVYEKLQIFELGKLMNNDWNIYIDSDALVHPDLMDITNLLPKNTVLHNGCDHAGNRWKYDRYFHRDGRHIGSCNWFAIASDWCIELWEPLQDLTFEEALGKINPTVNELNTIVNAAHLIDDYTLSRNIARYGLKFKTFQSLLPEIGQPQGQYLWHQYTIPNEQKIIEMHKVLKGWGLK
jgi:hypothetical protein